MPAIRWFSDERAKETLLIRIICIAWLCSKAISWKLWLADRFFPVIPVSEYFPQANPGFHFLLFILSICSLLACVIAPKSKILAAAVILAELVSCALDQMRWQPWEYQYLLSFCFLLFSKDRKQFFSLLAFLLAATYIFSGLHKFSGAFLYNIWDRTILVRLFGLSRLAISHPLHYFGLVIPVIEIVIGCGLAFSSATKKYIAGAVLMHILIVIALSPFGIGYNEVIIPWNIAMAFLIPIVFGSGELSLQIKMLKNPLNSIVFIIAGLLPLLGLFGYWDNYLSFNLYSGSENLLVVCSGNPQLSVYQTKSRHFQFSSNHPSIDANKWALDELKVPIYPEERTFSALKKQWEKLHDGDDAKFFLCRYPYRPQNIKEIE
ncbi:MAG: DoxX family protein [Flavobacterium sp.]|nr:MAG: DoxX family protein [Flavobacterium sp.]